MQMMRPFCEDSISVPAYVTLRGWKKLVIMIRTIQVHELWDKESARERNESLGNQIISQAQYCEGRERQKPL